MEGGGREREERPRRHQWTEGIKGAGLREGGREIERGGRERSEEVQEQQKAREAKEDQPSFTEHI